MTSASAVTRVTRWTLLVAVLTASVTPVTFPGSRDRGFRNSNSGELIGTPVGTLCGRPIPHKLLLFVVQCTCNLRRNRYRLPHRSTARGDEAICSLFLVIRHRSITRHLTPSPVTWLHNPLYLSSATLHIARVTRLPSQPSVRSPVPTEWRLCVSPLSGVCRTDVLQMMGRAGICCFANHPLPCCLFKSTTVYFFRCLYCKPDVERAKGVHLSSILI